LNLILGNGDGTFQTGVDYFSGALTEDELALVDFNQDGAPDALVTDRLENMSLLFNTGGSQVGLTSSSNPSTQGEEVVFTATITPTFPDTAALTGRVTFKDGATVLGTSRMRQGTAEFATFDLAAGEHSISATYSGNEIFNRRPSPVLSQIVDEIVAISVALLLTARVLL
jgi:Bacterial Ig-like domain (group 3)